MGNPVLDDQFRAIFLGASEGILVADVETRRLILANPKIGQMLGYTPEELIGKSVEDIHPAEAWPRVMACFEAQMRGEKALAPDLPCLRKNGTIIYADIHASSIQIDSREAGIGFFTDITERKGMIENLERNTAFKNALISLLQISMQDIPLQEQLEKALDAVLAMNIFKLRLKGAIFLVNGEKDVLHLRAHRGLDKSVLNVCARVPFGKCLCGRAAQDKKIVYADCLDHRHENSYAGIAGHGHYCVPILSKDKILGVLNLYLAEGHKRDEKEEGFLCAVADAIAGVIERKHAEEVLRDKDQELLQSHKMEAIGRLAGGVAHDFNNLLMAISGYSEFLLESIAEDSPFHDDVLEIKKAGDRAASLTRQLLAFSRRQILAPKVLDLNALIMGTDKMLRRLIGENIELIVLEEPDLGKIKADPGQMEQAIINLVLNARDTMPSGGKITVETMNMDLDEEAAGKLVDIAPGPHVCVSVSDTGSGMDADTLSRIFEPFFTTKEQGKGTGLGLATIYGVVKQSGGHITVASELGHGSTFKIYMPRHTEADSSSSSSSSSSSITSPTPRGTETILLVEDEERVRVLVKKFLLAQGYNVLEASNGNEALDVAKGHKERIHLVITDIVMPQMTGTVMAKELKKFRPDTNVLFMSGYTDVPIFADDKNGEETAFLQKPFDLNSLARKIREMFKAGGRNS